MARMYSGRKGKSGSKKPLEKKVQAWVRYKPKEVEMLIVKLAKEGKNAAQIGLTLRDTYGIPSVRTLLNKTISDVLKEKQLRPDVPEDVMALIRRSITIEKHRQIHKTDMTAKRGELLTTSKIMRLVKYYKGTGRLPENWKFEKGKIRLMIE